MPRGGNRIIHPTIIERLERAHFLDPESGCWRFTGCHTHAGYGKVSFRGKSELVHRAAYVLFVGPIPEGLTIDHVKTRGCRHRDCFNPAHLEAVPIGVNVRRGANAIKTACPRGHAYDYVDPTHGYRSCTRCANDARRARGGR